MLHDDDIGPLLGMALFYACVLFLFGFMWYHH